MKKSKILFLIIFMAFLSTGCGNSEMTRDLRHAGFNMDDEAFNCDALIPKRDKEYEKIKWLGSNYAITTNGVVHDISYGQIFSNNKHCMRANTEITVEAIIGEVAFRSKDNKIYYFKGSNTTELYKPIPNTDSNFSTYSWFLSDPTVVKVQNVGDSKYYVLKNNGTVYSYTIKKDRNGISLEGSPTAVYTAENLGSKIVDFNYAGNESETTFVRTEDKIFRNIALNRKDCNTYVDIVCEYEFGEDATLTKYYDRIMAYNGSILITDYLKVFRSGGKVKEDEE